MFWASDPKKWTELSIPQRVGAIALAATQIGLMVAALRDIRRRPAPGIKGSKRLWAAAAFVNFVGPVAYFAFGRKEA